MIHNEIKDKANSSCNCSCVEFVCSAVQKGNIGDKIDSVSSPLARSAAIGTTGMPFDAETAPIGAWVVEKDGTIWVKQENRSWIGRPGRNSAPYERPLPRSYAGTLLPGYVAKGAYYYPDGDPQK